MKKLLCLTTFIMILVSCSSSSSTEPYTEPTQDNSRLNKIVEVSYNSNGGVSGVSTTNFFYDQQNRLITQTIGVNTLGLDSSNYKYNSGSNLPSKIINKNNYNNNYTILSLKYDESARLKSVFSKEYNQGILYFTDSAAFIYNGNSRPSQVTHFQQSYHDSTLYAPYSLQYFYDGEKLIKSISAGKVSEFFYKDNLFDKVVTHHTAYQDTTLVEKIESGLIKKITTSNNIDGLLNWDFVYDDKNKIIERKDSIDFLLANRYTYQYNTADLLLNRKIYVHSANNTVYLTEYQYEYTAGSSNKKVINRLNRFRSDYSVGDITEFMPWKHPIDLP